jgi:ATP-dependent Clp protease protease subunit
MGARMIKKIGKTILEAIAGSSSDKKIVILDPAALAANKPPPEPDLRIIGIFGDVDEEKVTETAHSFLYMNEMNRLTKNEKDRRPIEFYISTYGGNADDMFALYDIMRQVREETEIHTIGMGKVMSAGVLLLAGGTKGKRKIGKNCRVMIHSVIAGNHGNVHNLVNEMEAIQALQEMYINSLVEETNMSKSRMKKMLERKVNVYLSAEEAVELGIADEII